MVISARNTEYVIMRLQTIVVGAPIALDHQADQRQDERHQSSRSVIVSVLGTGNRILHGEIRNISEGETQIRLDQPLRYASLVAIDYNDNRLLGEVVYCEEEQAGWLVGIRVEHVLLGLTTLASSTLRSSHTASPRCFSWLSLAGTSRSNGGVVLQLSFSVAPKGSVPYSERVGGGWYGNPPVGVFKPGCGRRRLPDTGYLDAGSRQRQVPLLLFSEGTIFTAHTH